MLIHRQGTSHQTKHGENTSVGTPGAERYFLSRMLVPKPTALLRLTHSWPV